MKILSLVFGLSVATCWLSIGCASVQVESETQFFLNGKTFKRVLVSADTSDAKLRDLAESQLVKGLSKHHVFAVQQTRIMPVAGDGARSQWNDSLKKYDFDCQLSISYEKAIGDRRKMKFDPFAPLPYVLVDDPNAPPDAEGWTRIRCKLYSMPSGDIVWTAEATAHESSFKFKTGFMSKRFYKKISEKLVKDGLAN
jgi:hypothetical protein